MREDPVLQGGDEVPPRTRTEYVTATLARRQLLWEGWW
jgi:hypothetical protein